MKIKYVEDKNYFSYESNGISSGFEVSPKNIEVFLKNTSIDYEALTTDGVIVTDQDVNILKHLWVEDKYQEYKGLHFCKEYLDSKRDIADMIVTAVDNQLPLCVIYEEGHCVYSSREETDPMVSQDGLTHIVLVGKTTGEKKFPLALASKYSDGGDILYLCGIKEVILLKGI